MADAVDRGDRGDGDVSDDAGNGRGVLMPLAPVKLPDTKALDPHIEKKFLKGEQRAYYILNMVMMLLNMLVFANIPINDFRIVAWMGNCLMMSGCVRLATELALALPSAADWPGRFTDYTLLGAFIGDFLVRHVCAQEGVLIFASISAMFVVLPVFATADKALQFVQKHRPEAGCSVRFWIYFLVACAPTSLRSHIMFNRSSGSNVEWTDNNWESFLTVLRSYNTDWSEERSAVMSPVKPTKKARFDNPPSGPNASVSRGNGAGGAALRPNRPQSSSSLPDSIPVAQRSKTWSENARLWVLGNDKATSERLFRENKCPICHLPSSKEHNKKNCPKAAAKFAAGEMFFYPAVKK